MKKTVRVVGAIILSEADEVLCALRSPEMSLPNYWEFPGGKIEVGESIQEAVIREIKEELNCEIEAFDIFNDYTHEYEHIFVNLITVMCKLVNGIPTASEHSELKWIPKQDLKSLHWAPADIPAVELLSK
ncbi:NUDIX domain-containing protein [Turicibacter sanguinis]|nr:NUDIX domain-containing protein [Turicibacter sanguinis]MTN83757.1 NUDIX domain-containing protein [Turicibacter sanguinis]MTN86402.1 NUDIX domain-containing protein [Turicibacter sanguinis]MTN89587.1 NUDIX domain-containing protein [Turicibacter sanguinis]MTN92271.1 NUDIX domain-containing protein [Turicibacter sanguinis]